MSHSAWRIAAVMIVPALSFDRRTGPPGYGYPGARAADGEIISAESHVNDRVEFEVSEDVKIGTSLLLRPALAGSVVEASPRCRLLRSGPPWRSISAASAWPMGKAAPCAVLPRRLPTRLAAHPSEEGPLPTFWRCRRVTGHAFPLR